MTKFAVSENESALAQAAKRFLDHEYTFSIRQQRLKDGPQVKDWTSLADQGWLGLFLPSEQGGIGCTRVEACAALRAFGAALHLEPTIPIAVHAATILGDCRPAPLRNELVAKILTGAARPIMISGASVSGMPRNKGIEVTGALEAVSGGSAATHFLLDLPQIGGLLVVDRDAPGVSVDTIASIDGSSLANVRFQEVLVREGQRLVCDRQVLAHGADMARLAACAWLTGVMVRAFELTLDHVKTRRQFNKSLYEFQAVRHHLANMLMATEMADAALRRAATAQDGSRLVLGAYVVALNSGLKVTSLAIQLHGGMGMSEDHIVGHQYRTLLAYQAAFGACEEKAAALGARWTTSNNEATAVRAG